MYLERFRLDGRVAVITGGAGAIGLAIAEALAESGAKVIITDITTEVLDAAHVALLAKGYSVETYLMDVTRSENVDAVASDIICKHERIDILVNNAGIARSETPAEKVDDEHWLNVIDVNLNGTFWCARAFGRFMLSAKSGVIVNIGSMSGFVVNRPQEQSYYNASKAAVHQLTRSLAAEWAARGVRVNAVAPTYIRTPLNEFAENNKVMYGRWIDSTPMARLGTVDEVASVVLFLACDASSLMTGSIVLADGGYTCW